VTRYVREADISFGNLESPFVPHKAFSEKNVGAKVIFIYAEKQSASALRLVGISKTSQKFVGKLHQEINLHKQHNWQGMAFNSGGGHTEISKNF